MTADKQTDLWSYHLDCLAWRDLKTKSENYNTCNAKQSSISSILIILELQKEVHKFKSKISCTSLQWRKVPQRTRESFAWRDRACKRTKWGIIRARWKSEIMEHKLKQGTFNAEFLRHRNIPFGLLCHVRELSISQSPVHSFLFRDRTLYKVEEIPDAMQTTKLLTFVLPQLIHGAEVSPSLANLTGSGYSWCALWAMEKNRDIPAQWTWCPPQIAWRKSSEELDLGASWCQFSPAVWSQETFSK